MKKKVIFILLFISTISFSNTYKEKTIEKLKNSQFRERTNTFDEKNVIIL